MANLKKWMQFVIQWEGDGSNAQVVVDFLNDPVSFIPPSGAGLSPAFNIAQSLPNSVSNVVVGGAATLSSFSYNAALGRLTVIFVSAPGNGVQGIIQGQLNYS